MRHKNFALAAAMDMLRCLVAIGACLILAACNTQPDAQPRSGGPEEQSTESGTKATPAPQATESASILRPEIVPPETRPSDAPLEPLFATIGFPDGGSTLDADAIVALEGIAASPQIQRGLPITLGAHSDSAGSDVGNLRSSEERGLAVATWLIDKGVDADRITVIAFGEQNPAQPNALPDGTANKEGRAANRRVEVNIDVQMEAEAEQGTLSDSASPQSSDATSPST